MGEFIYNAEQLKAQSISSHLLVNACPGSGKTGGVIVPKAVNEVRNGGSAIAVTFTRAAAAELRERLHRLLPTKEEQDRVIVGTFHSIISYQLRRGNIRINVVDPGEQDRIINAALSEAGVFDVRLRDEIKTAVDAAKRSLAKPVLKDEATAAVYDTYQARLQANNQIDLNDLITTAVRQMRSADNRLAPLMATLMLVDEFHDCDDPQLQWVLDHAKAGVPVCAVADDDQAIYGFRASLGYKGVKTFVEELSAAEVTLKTNYRSHREILDVASTLIKHNQFRIDKPMYAFKGQGGTVTVVSSPTRLTECQDIAYTIKRDAKPEPDGNMLTVPKGAWMVIARNNSYLDALSLELRRCKIRVANVDYSKVWRRRPLCTLVSLLQAADGNASAFRDALRPAGMDNKTIDALEAASAGNPYAWILSGKASMPSTIDRDSASGSILAELINLLPQWVALANTAKEAMKDNSSPQRTRRANTRIRQAISSIGTSITGTVKDIDPDKRATTLATLEMGVSIILSQPGTSITARVDSAIEAGKKPKENADGVYIYTMHGSKGLESDNVWLMTCDSSVIPSETSPEDEERRLFYVAVTRARRNLIVSYAESGNGVEKPRSYHPTGFLSEMGLTVVAADKAFPWLQEEYAAVA